MQERHLTAQEMDAYWMRHREEWTPERRELAKEEPVARGHTLYTSRPPSLRKPFGWERAHGKH